MLTPGPRQDKVNGLEGGADDYITSLPRRVSCWRGFKRSTAARGSGADDIVEVEGLKLDDSSHRVSAGERERWAHRIPPAAFLHYPSGTRIYARSVARPCLGG